MFAHHVRHSTVAPREKQYKVTSYLKSHNNKMISLCVDTPHWTSCFYQKVQATSKLIESAQRDDKLQRNIGVRPLFTKLSYLQIHIFTSRYGRGMWRSWGRGEVCTGLWWGNLRERDHWWDPDVDGRIILRWIFRKWEGVVGTGWSWLRIGTGGGHLWVR